MSTAPAAGDAIGALRERERVSRAVLARYLKVTTGRISQSKRGEKHPAGASLKLLSLIERPGLDSIP